MDEVNADMSSTTIYPYTVEVEPCPKPAGTFKWLIRRKGRLVQRAFTPSRSERAAFEAGEKQAFRQIESDMKD